MIDKTSVANVIAAVVILAGVISVFLGIEANEMLLIITGAGIGYLFKNGIPKRTPANLKPQPDVVSTQ